MNPHYVPPPEPWTTAWPALPALLMVAIGLWGCRRRIRPDRWMWGVLALALLVRVVALPSWEHQYDGHEADYRDLLLGDRALTRGGTLLYPAFQWLHFLAGKVAPHEAVPLLLSLLAGLLAVGAAGGAVGRLTTPRVGHVTALALALWGNHAFWATSAYNVILPHALAVTAIWALAVWLRGGPAWACGLLAGGAAALAVATRVESWLWAPVGLLLVLAHRPRGALKALPGVFLGAGIAGLATYLIMFPGHTPGSGQRSLSWAVNRDLLAYWAPFDVWWTWLIPLAGFGLGLRRWPKVYAPLLLLVVGSHALFATFDDYGFRHLLNALVGVSAALGALVTVRWGWPLLGLAGLGLVAHTWDVGERYYASEEDFADALPDALPRWEVEQLGACALICEDGRVVDEDSQRSHFNLLDPAEAEAMRADAGCIYWVYGLQDHRWSSRAVRDRALRLLHLYEMTPAAVVSGDQDFVGLVYEVGQRR